MAGQLVYPAGLEWLSQQYSSQAEREAMLRSPTLGERNKESRYFLHRTGYFFHLICNFACAHPGISRMLMQIYIHIYIMCVCIEMCIYVDIYMKLHTCTDTNVLYGHT